MYIMPYRMHYIPSKRCYTVRRKKTKREKLKNKLGTNTRKNRKVFAKCTTKEKATKQIRLLRAIKFNPNFKPIKKPH